MNLFTSIRTFTDNWFKFWSYALVCAALKAASQISESLVLEIIAGMSVAVLTGWLLELCLFHLSEFTKGKASKILLITITMLMILLCVGGMAAGAIYLNEVIDQIALQI